MSASRDDMLRRLGIDPAGDSRVDDVGRRHFVKLLSASLALAGVEGCTRMPPSEILPYVNQPELTPGVPQYYATSMVLDGCATGLLLESHEGRPTKVEGNPEHPASLGAAGVFEQASVLQLYDPDRAKEVRHEGHHAEWRELAEALAPDQLRTQVGDRGAGLAVLMPPTSSPLEAELLDRVRGVYPAASVHFAAPLAFADEPLVPQLDLEQADVVVAVDADFLSSGPFHLRWARQFAARRRPDSPGMNRCYVIESSVTPTGMTADHRFALRPGEITSALELLLAAVGERTPAAEVSSRLPWIGPIADDLRTHRGRSLVIAGRFLPPRARALALDINQALGNVGQTIWYTPSPLLSGGNEVPSFAALVERLRAGAVDTLICIGGNPSYAHPAGQELGELLRHVRQSVYLGLYENETAGDCRWTVPAAHYLESWGDARAYDGTLSIVQPLIEPMWNGRTTVELLSLLVGDAAARPYDLLQQSWRASGRIGDGSEFADGWRRVLGRGLQDGSAFATAAAPPTATADSPVAQLAPVELLFRPHPRVFDGSFANNAWLQELPDPVTTLTWDNAAHISPAMADRLAIVTGDIVDLRAAGGELGIPALVVPGHADDCVTLCFGYGRGGAEALARNVGINVYPLWPGDRFAVGGAEVTRAADRSHRQLALTQPHHVLRDSSPARAITLAELPHLEPPRGRALTLYEPRVDLPDGPGPNQWAMAIDLGQCIGCGACTVACQAENNIPVVGREDVLLGREMHWLRIDWYAPETGQPRSLAQPMLCQHCEKAPCEYVCPVEATVHSRDGLNEMIYNRCVGTRFCSNNCPYRVRRFNWFDYSARLGPAEQLVKNPDVTVRDRGVMEKCTFCVQRIRQAEIAARGEGRPVAGESVTTACQQACPTRAIVFGSLTDAESEVVRQRASARSYAVLDDLGTEPRVRYLARVRNPNPALEKTT